MEGPCHPQSPTSLHTIFPFQLALTSLTENARPLFCLRRPRPPGRNLASCVSTLSNLCFQLLCACLCSAMRNTDLSCIPIRPPPPHTHVYMYCTFIFLSEKQNDWQASVKLRWKLLQDLRVHFFKKIAKSLAKDQFYEENCIILLIIRFSFEP